MKTIKLKLNSVAVLDRAIVAGLIAIFAAIAIPLVRGALLRQRTAECAQKIMQAAEAFNFYAATVGTYPPNPGASQQADTQMQSIFSTRHMDWWARKTELGGQWSWCRTGKDNLSIVIAGSWISERQMIRLDAVLDDGNLETGAFRRLVGSYHYMIQEVTL